MYMEEHLIRGAYMWLLWVGHSPVEGVCRYSSRMIKQQYLFSQWFKTILWEYTRHFCVLGVGLAIRFHSNKELMAEKLENDCLRTSNSFICNIILHGAASVILLKSSFRLGNIPIQSFAVASYLNQNRTQSLPRPRNAPEDRHSHHLPYLPVASYLTNHSPPCSLSSSSWISLLLLPHAKQALVSDLTLIFPSSWNVLLPDIIMVHPFISIKSLFKWFPTKGKPDRTCKMAPQIPFVPILCLILLLTVYFTWNPAYLLFAYFCLSQFECKLHEIRTWYCSLSYL